MVQYDEEYYDMLRACDKLYNICIEHYRTLRGASRALGYKNDKELYGRLRLITCNLGVHFLCRLCRHFNVSLQSLFFNDNNKYTIKDITYKNFIKIVNVKIVDVLLVLLL